MDSIFILIYEAAVWSDNRDHKDKKIIKLFYSADEALQYYKELPKQDEKNLISIKRHYIMDSKP